MNAFIRLPIILLCLTGLSAFVPAREMTGPAAKAPDYRFNKKISRGVLENYLERSITMQRMLTGEGNFDDNLRMIKNIGAKFIGRAVCQWGGEADLLKNFALEKELAAR